MSFDLDKLKKKRACSGRPCVYRSAPKKFSIGITFEYTNSVATVLNSLNEIFDFVDIDIPTSFNANVKNNINDTHGSASLGVDYDVGVGSKAIASLDIIEANVEPDAEVTISSGVGARAYFKEGRVVGIGFAIGSGASFLSRPISKKPVNLNAGGDNKMIEAIW